MKMRLIKNQWFLTLLLIPLLLPHALTDMYPQLDLWHSVLRILVCAVVLVLYIAQDQISKFALCVILYNILMMASIILQSDVWIPTNIAAYIASIATTLLLDMCLKIDAKTIIQSCVNLLTLLIVLNFVFLLIYPDGIVQALAPDNGIEYYARKNLLGIDNSLAFWFIPYMAILPIYTDFFKKDWLNYIILVIVTITVFITWSATGVVAWAIILLYILIIEHIHLKNLVNFMNILTLSVVLFLGLVVFRIQNIFSFLIEGVLGKSLTFTGRTYAWDISVDLISERPIFGWGLDAHVILMSFDRAYVTAHNQIYEILLIGGICAFFMWACIIFLMGKRLQEHKKHPFAKMLTVSIFSLLTAFLMEAVSSVSISILFVVAYRVPDIIAQYEASEKRRMIGLR